MGCNTFKVTILADDHHAINFRFIKNNFTIQRAQDDFGNTNIWLRFVKLSRSLQLKVSLVP